MIIKHFRVLFACLISIKSPALDIYSFNVSESPLSRHITQPTITSIHSDNRGFLWIGTQHGLYRFDGADYVFFDSDINNRNWIPASDIREISEFRGSVLVATFGGGLLLWDRHAKKFEHLGPKSLGSQRFITHLLSTGSGRIGIVSNEGLSIISYSEDNFNFLKKHSFDLTQIGRVNAIEEDSEGNIVVASDRGLFVLDNSSMSLEKILSVSELHGEHIISLESGFNGKLIMGGDKGTIYVLSNYDKPPTANKIFIDEVPRSITSLLLSNSILWIGTSDGLAQTSIDFQESSLVSTKNSDLTSNHVTDIFQIDDLVFIGTYKGLNQIYLSDFELFNFKNSNIYNDVLAFEEDPDGKIWIGTFNGLFKYDEASNTHLDFSLDNNNVQILDSRITALESVNEDLWLGFRRNGIQILLDEKNTSVPSFGKNMEVTKILRSSQGNVWVASYNNGLHQIAGSKVQSFFASSNPEAAAITDILETSDDRILVATETEIFEFIPEKEGFDPINFRDPIKHRAPLVLTIKESNEGEIWVGTKDRGVFILRYDAKRDEPSTGRYTVTSNILTSYTIYGIQFDEESNVWCSTQDGLLKLNKNGDLLRKFTTAHGLQGQDFNFGASFKDSKGRIYFGGTNGYNRFHPTKVDSDESGPKLSINAIKIIGRSSSVRENQIEFKRIVISYFDYLVTFNFSVLDFLDPERNQYRYKLENFDPDWIDNGNRNTATYTNLPPGDYILRVQGANAAGTWNREGVSLNVTVLPPPWRTWWAYCGYLVVLLAVAWTLRRVYDSYMYKLMTERLTQEIYATRDKADDDLQEQLEYQDDLIRSIYRHNIGTLESIKDYISIQAICSPSRPDPEAVDGNLQRIMSLKILEECVQFDGNLLSADLRKYTDILISSLLPGAAVPAETITTINKVDSAPVSVETASPVAVVMFELLKNSFQHAFDSRSLANYVEIAFGPTLDSDNNMLQYALRISDNGVGIPSGIDINQPETTGFAIIQTISDKVGGELKATAEEGTVIEFVFPDPDSRMHTPIHS